MTLYVLDTDHISLFQRGHSTVVRRVLSVSEQVLSTTIVSVEEQLQGWMSVLRRAPPERLPTAYAHLSRAMEYFHTIRVLDFDPDALACFQTLQKEKLRIGTKDLRIAAVALSQQAILVTRNAKDFSQIPGVNLEDWSIEASA